MPNCTFQCERSGSFGWPVRSMSRLPLRLTRAGRVQVEHAFFQPLGQGLGQRAVGAKAVGRDFFKMNIPSAIGRKIAKSFGGDLHRTVFAFALVKGDVSIAVVEDSFEAFETVREMHWFDRGVFPAAV